MATWYNIIIVALNVKVRNRMKEANNRLFRRSTDDNCLSTQVVVTEQYNRFVMPIIIGLQLCLLFFCYWLRQLFFSRSSFSKRSYLCSVLRKMSYCLITDLAAVHKHAL